MMSDSSMTTHTPEPWTADEHGNIGAGSPEYIIASLNILREANARRIVACVNALAGVPTKNIAKFMTIPSEMTGSLWLNYCAMHEKNNKLAEQNETLLAEIDRLRAEKAELVANLRTAWSVASACTGQMHRTASLIVEDREKNDLRYVAMKADSTLDTLHKAITAAEALK